MSGKVDLTQISAKSILNTSKRIDSWFVSRYSMNIYRGCAHNCAYCDGRAEGYYVEGDFGRDIVAKVNCAALLDRALNPKGKRKPRKPGYILLGGGVCDSYQPAEVSMGLTRSCLEMIEKWNHPVHILTKSALVVRDLDILQRIHGQKGAIVSMSFSTLDDRVAGVFEPGCALPSKRLVVLKELKKAGLGVGVFLMPVIPGVSDKLEQMREYLEKFREVGVDFVLFGGMTLKEGRQQDHYMRVLKKWDSSLVAGYEKVYRGNKWGGPIGAYSRAIEERFVTAATEVGIARRMPSRLFSHLVDKNDAVQVILEQMDYLLKSTGKKSPFGVGAHSIASLQEPIENRRNDLQTLKGIGPATEKCIQEIVDTGSCEYYLSLLGESSP